MNTRRVYTLPDVERARRAIAELRSLGVEDRHMSLVARADIELECVPEGRKEADTDMMPAAVKGFGAGGATGLLAGIVAAVVPPLGVTLAGAAMMTIAGAAIGGWVSALIGSTVPDPIRRKFEAEIEAGRILLIVDADKDLQDAEQALVARHGGEQLPYSSTQALT